MVGRENEGNIEMRKVSILIMAVWVFTSVGMAEDITASATFDLASAYVFRGATLNDGLVFQHGGMFHLSDFDLGVWGNLDIDDYNGTLKQHKFNEVDIIAGYNIPCEAADLSVGYTAYTYPNDGVDSDHEVTLAAGLDVVLAPSLSVNYGLYGGIEDSIYVELGLGHELELSKNVGAAVSVAVGYLEADEGESGFSHADISAGLSYKAVSATVTYVAQLEDDVLPDLKDGGMYDTKVYGSLGVKVGF